MQRNPDMARQFGIMQSATLVITDGEHLKKYVNASNIQRYVDEELHRITVNGVNNKQTVRNIKCFWRFTFFRKGYNGKS